MATLIMKSIECIRANDVVGADEPYLTVDGQPVWSGSMKKGETEVLSGGRADETDFTGSVLVRLLETNNSSSKQIDVPHRVDDDPTNNGKAVFKTSGTHYEVEYRVVA